MFKIADAVQGVIVTPFEFANLVYGSNVKIAGASLEKRGQEMLPGKLTDYIFSHSTIIVSVDVEESTDWKIKPRSTPFVNSNGDAWERRLLASTYKTFIGKPNYVNHVQVPKLAVGKIIDAVPVEYPDALYIHILTATHRKHSVSKSILDGTVRAMSMGASVAYTFCTRCGHKIVDYNDVCEHIQYERNRMYRDEEDGTVRVIVELCGHRDDPTSNVFVEASWVEIPAFMHAQTHQVVDLASDPSLVVSNDQSVLVVSGETASSDQGNERVVAFEGSGGIVVSDEGEPLEKAAMRKVAAGSKVPEGERALVMEDPEDGYVSKILESLSESDYRIFEYLVRDAEATSEETLELAAKDDRVLQELLEQIFSNNSKEEK